ncbi:tRNA (guanosine(37)-N1)-methyltransferase TrmD [Helicobacter hepaticus]|jgi:tRNA (guanine37-N1)-methyltransferase|uniref:tRNA (guanine-N(1)-)-methyltransferase n=1 Tax=Helicobacter hepaticus (strain ATCC 51449 / 3B1) TaxID=235279 RepID=TRMD_HELHP|nr:tRNA (guanosine(37)-N1)-methyltransferase TrmD [Helicobacter hepaticus]Q7U321.2 RecName: Full=tRNA (guanine-N(1)-)-methyltransferase; AltName: Full=M1G-methyltransferase; AltName: Full=tRNA [GM37] methyltransferase [Helicobacter hepaticus ATCC 51449]
MQFSFLTLFPTLIESYFTDSILKRALQNGLISVEALNIRDYALDKYQKVDEPPISGGAGQVIRADVLGAALQTLTHSHIIFLSPCGKPFQQYDALRLSHKKHITFVCGRYEGFDERLVEQYANEVMSVGNFIVTGGELPALMLCDSIARHIQGVLGNADSLQGESFEDYLLEAPNFTKIFNQKIKFSATPSEYSKGNHSKISGLKKRLAICKTKYFRPDLYQAYRVFIEQQQLNNKVVK